MRTCIYCDKEKNDSDFTFEHVIPQSLGGSYAPDRFKTHDVCKSCNSTAGLFVDAAFEKDWFVQNWLLMSAMAFFDPEQPSALPLICMGVAPLNPPGIMSDEVCELWIGPRGEQVYWIRKHDENLYWYVGGNPRTARDSESRAYFIFSERTLKNPIISWLAFREAFRGRKKIKKVMCTEVQGGDPKEIGFSEPDDVDVRRIEFFKSRPAANDGSVRNQLSFNVNFDRRFMAKLGLGIGYCLFGHKALETDCGKELRRGIWFKERNTPEGVDSEIPRIQGLSAWSSKAMGEWPEYVGEEHAVCMIVLATPDGVVINLNIGRAMSGTVKCADIVNLTSEDIDPIGDGLVILLYKHLQTSVTLSLMEYVAHKLGNIEHPRLAEINRLIAKNDGYFRKLN